MITEDDITTSFKLAILLIEILNYFRINVLIVKLKIMEASKLTYIDFFNL